MGYEEVFSEEAAETVACWRCGGEVVLEADETGDICDGCIEEEVGISREDRRRAALGDSYEGEGE